MRRAAPFSILGIALITAAACSDATEPEPIVVTEGDLVGSYQASTFVGHDSGTDIDVLAQGGSLSITLNPDGTTEGTMFVPQGAEDGSDYTANLTGTWTLDSGMVVTFDHAADTFIRDVAWETYDDGTIRTDNEFARVVLARD